MNIINVTQTTVGSNNINTVNARELHSYLLVGKKFSDWIKDRIEAYSFEVNVDYLVLIPNLGKTLGRPVMEYHVSLDMAKELSMVDRGVKGKEARKYFLECEKKSKEVVPMLPTDYVSALKALVMSEESRILIKTELVQAQPKIKFYDTVTSSENCLTITEVAKSLNIGRNHLYKQLRDSNILCKDNTPMQRYMKQGWFEVEAYTFQDSIGEDRVSTKTVVTGKGFTEIGKLV